MEKSWKINRKIMVNSRKKHEKFTEKWWKFQGKS